MKAILLIKYGSPDVLELLEMERPAPKDNEVLIKIHASTVTAVDATFRKGRPLIGRLFTGLISPKRAIPGTEFSGMVEAAGRDVKRFKMGDRVFGTTNGLGAHTEYLCLPVTKLTLALMPANTTFDEAACCDGFLTALPFLRDTGKIQSGQKVLINGASGSVGAAAVQLAKHFGAEVTGVCSTANLELVKSLGADRVIDYNHEDFTENGQSYDIIFDTVGKLSFSRCRGSLKPGGIFLEATLSGGIIFQMLWTSMFGSKKAKMAFTGLRPVKERSKDLEIIGELIESGKLRAVIERRYRLNEIAEAHRLVDTGHKKGNVVIAVADS